MGVRWNEQYFSDPHFRHAENGRIASWLGPFNAALQERVARYNVDWEPAGVSGIIGMYSPEAIARYAVGQPQPFVVVTALFGGDVCYFDSDNPDVAGYPLAAAAEPDDIKIPDVLMTSPMSNYLAQYNELAARVGAENVDMCGFLYLHSPMSIGYRLRGEQLFLDMVDRPDMAAAVLDAALETSCAAWDECARRSGPFVPPMRLAADIAPLISPGLYRTWEVPRLQAEIDRYGPALIHSCGRTSNVLEVLAELTSVAVMEVGAGTDIARTRALFPDAAINYVMDTAGLVNAAASDVRKEIADVLVQGGPGRVTAVWAVETGTPLENIEAVYAAVGEYNDNL
jgi:uroporphyrinogen-III decarboxylase